MWRQGDVLIAAVNELPQGATFRPDGILARGESTGHCHRVEAPTSAELWELNGELYLKVVVKQARILHEEHQPITLSYGVYRVWCQREYRPERNHAIYD